MTKEKEQEYEERITYLEKKVFSLEKSKEKMEADIYKLKNVVDRISPSDNLIRRYL